MPVPLPKLAESTWKLMEPHGNDFELQKPESTYRDTVTALRYVFENRGIDLSELSMNFRAHSYGFVGPRGGDRYRGLAALEPLLARDPKLGEVAKKLGVPYGDSCEKLAQLSRAALSL